MSSNYNAILGSPFLQGAFDFAQVKHRGQVRKGTKCEAYFVHVADVAMIVAEAAGTSDEDLIAAALLHDVVEDCGVSPEEISRSFGATVAGLVSELTDPEDVTEAERRQAQVDHAPHLSPKAKLIKVADKISNLQEMLDDPPAGWGAQKQLAYLNWGEAVFEGAQGENRSLDENFRLVAKRLHAALDKG